MGDDEGGETQDDYSNDNDHNDNDENNNDNDDDLTILWETFNDTLTNTIRNPKF